ncbi:linear amide C-N hydrolase [Methylolobus aquaticus]
MKSSTVTPPRAITRRATKAALSAVCTLILAAASTTGRACSDIMLPPPPGFKKIVRTTTVPSEEIDASAISARTMDFDPNLAWYMENQAKGQTVTATNPRQKNMQPMQWTSLYNLVGFSGAPGIVKGNGRYFDGMNEKGLSAAMLWLEDAWPLKEDSKSQYPEPQEGDRNLSVQFVVNFVLSMCDSVRCAVNLFEENPRPVVWGEGLNFRPLSIEIPLGLHLVLHDARNHSAVIEWHDKQQFIYARTDSHHVLTNEPPLPDQLSALRNPDFRRLTSTNHFKEVDSDLTQPFMNLLPGDSSSGSRFITTKKLSSAITKDVHEYWPVYPDPTKTLTPRLWRVQLANRIMARVEEVYGEAPVTFLGYKTGIYFHTQFTVIRDHSNLNLYVRGVYNPALRRIHLADLFKGNPASYSKKLFVDPRPDLEDYKLIYYQDVTDMFASKLPKPPSTAVGP